MKYRSRSTDLVVDAHRFNCQDSSTAPRGFEWHGLKPTHSDASWGSVEIQGEAIFVFHGDWIVSVDGTVQRVYRPDAFEKYFAPLEADHAPAQ